MHAHPDDIVTLLSKDAQHRVAQRAISAIGRCILLYIVFLAGIDCAVEHERGIHRVDVIQRLAKGHRIVDGQGVATAGQVIGHEAVLDSNGGTRLDHLGIASESNFFAIDTHVKGHCCAVKSLGAPVPHIEGDWHLISLFHKVGTLQRAGLDQDFGEIVFFNDALNTQVAIRLQAGGSPTVLSTCFLVPISIIILITLVNQGQGFIGAGLFVLEANQQSAALGQIELVWGRQINDIPSRTAHITRPGNHRSVGTASGDGNDKDLGDGSTLGKADTE